MKPHIKTLTWAIGLVLLLGCGSVAYYQHSDLRQASSSRLTIKKQVGQYTLSVQCLTPDELSKREADGDLELQDSLRSLYAQSRTFLLTVDGGKDLAQMGVQSYQDFKIRSEELYFHIAEYIELNTETASYRPVLTEYINAYEVDQRKQFYLVFCDTEEPGDLLTSSTLKLTFNDELFHSGISHFTFRKNDIDNSI